MENIHVPAQNLAVHGQNNNSHPRRSRGKGHRESHVTRPPVKSKSKGQKGSGAVSASESHYLRTILDPVETTGVKIPDSITCPSFPVHGLDVQELTVNAQGIAGIAYIVGSESGADVYTVGTAGTAGALSWTLATKAFATQLVGDSAAVRPVSALLTGQYEGAFSTEKGRVSVAYIPGVTATGTAGPNFSGSLPQSIIACINAPYAETMSAKKEFAEVRYIPYDPECFVYSSTAASPARLQKVSSVAVQPQYGIMLIVYDGCNVGDVIETEYYENLECLPQNTGSVSLVTTTPSYTDPIELAVVSNALADYPGLAVMQNKVHVQAGTADTMAGSLGSSGAKATSHLNTETPFLDAALSIGKELLHSKTVHKAAGAIPVIGGALEAALDWLF